MINKLMGIVMPVIMAVWFHAAAQEYQQDILGEWWSPQKDSRKLFTVGNRNITVRLFGEQVLMPKTFTTPMHN